MLLSIPEAARAGVSTRTIRTWITAGRLEAFRIEGDRRVYVALDYRSSTFLARSLEGVGPQTSSALKLGTLHHCCHPYVLDLTA